MNPLKRLLGYSRPYRGWFVLALLGMLLYGGASTWLLILMRPIVDKVVIRQEAVSTVAWSILLSYLLKGLGSYVSAYLMADIGQRVVRDIRDGLFRHTLGQSAAFFKSRSTGQLLSRLTNDVGLVQQVVSETMADLLRESIAVVGFAGVLFYNDVGLALVCLTGAPLIVYPLVRLGHALRKTTRRSQEHLESMTHVATEAFTGLRIVKAFGAEDREGSRFGAATRAVYRANMKVTAAMSMMPPIMELLGGVAIAAALWYGAREIAALRMTPGQYFQCVGALLLMYGPLKKLSRVNANVQQAIAASQRIFELMDTHTEVPDSSTRTGRGAQRSEACRLPFAPDRRWPSSAEVARARPASSICSLGSTIPRMALS
jgi:subfamily B ATP-binding cassette protein MsbA